MLPVLYAFLDQIRDVKITDLIDIALVTTFFYSALVLLRRTQARLVAIGILFLGALYIAARAGDLRLTTWLLQGFFAVFLVIAVVIFQEELRQLFERLALWGLPRRRSRKVEISGPVEVIVRCAVDLAHRRTGALIVVAGRQPLARHLHGGIELNGQLSEPLLLSIFEPHSPGHDGAMIVERGILTRFAVQLPLSTDFRQLAGLGMRHSAALGLSELNDALCVVVSEERGRVSIARRGVLRALNSPAELEPVLREFLRSTFPTRAERRVLRPMLTQNWVEKIASLGLVIGLWYLFVPGSRPATLAYPVAVKVVNVPPGYELERVEPPEVTAIFTGLRRDFYLFDPRRIDVVVDATLARYGRRTFPITEEQIRHPPDVSVEDVQPEQVRLSLRTLPNGATPAEAPPASGEGG